MRTYMTNLLFANTMLHY